MRDFGEKGLTALEDLSTASIVKLQQRSGLLERNGNHATTAFIPLSIFANQMDESPVTAQDDFDSAPAQKLARTS
jgi:hypothetical protein